MYCLIYNTLASVCYNGEYKEYTINIYNFRECLLVIVRSSLIEAASKRNE